MPCQQFGTAMICPLLHWTIECWLKLPLFLYNLVPLCQTGSNYWCLPFCTFFFLWKGLFIFLSNTNEGHKLAQVNCAVCDSLSERNGIKGDLEDCDLSRSQELGEKMILWLGFQPKSCVQFLSAADYFLTLEKHRFYLIHKIGLTIILLNYLLTKKTKTINEQRTQVEAEKQRNCHTFFPSWY